MTQPMYVDYARPAERRRLRVLSISAIIIAIIATGTSVALTFADLWPIPAGTTSVVAMGLALNVLLIAVATFAIGITLALIAVVLGRRDPLSVLLAILAIAASLAPAPAEKLTANWIAAKHSWVWGGSDA